MPIAARQVKTPWPLGPPPPSRRDDANGGAFLIAWRKKKLHGVVLMTSAISGNAATRLERFVTLRTDGCAARHPCRAGHYERNLETKAGEVTLKVPKLQRQTFETTIIERYRRREASVEEARIEMYLACVSVRRVEDITEGLWGHAGFAPSTVSDLNKKVYGTIQEWRNRPIAGEHPFVFDDIVMKGSWAGEVRNASLLVANCPASFASRFCRRASRGTGSRPSTPTL